MDRKARMLSCLDYVDPYRFHRRPCPKGMPARLERLVLHTSLAKDTTSAYKAGSKAHPPLKGGRLNGIDNLEKLELEGAMQNPIRFQEGLIDPSLALVR